MKINWGTGIVIGMIVFMTFIMVLVITMLTNKEFDHDLVTEGYYEKDLVYQNEIDAETNSGHLSAEIIVQKSNEGLQIVFPGEVLGKDINGMVEMYRPSNKKLDFQMPIHLTDSTLLIPAEKLVNGQWKVTVVWEMEGQKYLFKKQMEY
jgi:nitrogen fixation protein FixH